MAVSWESPELQSTHQYEEPTLSPFAALDALCVPSAALGIGSGCPWTQQTLTPHSALPAPCCIHPIAPLTQRQA